MTNVLIGTVRDALPLDLLRSNVGESSIEDALQGLFSADQVRGFMAPPDHIAEFIYAFSRTVEGRQFFEWILDCSLRAPYVVKAATIEETALNAAKREGLNTLAEMILAAISRGEKSLAARSPGARQ